MSRGEDAVYSAVVWTPILAIVVVLSVMFYGGLGHFEAMSNGTSVVVPNDGITAYRIK